MSEKDFSGKLAAGMRRAKQPAATEATAPATPSVTPAAQPATPRPSGESLSAGRENPRALHPKRVWPD